MSPSSLIAATGLQDYFFQQIRQAFNNQKIDAAPHTEFYLVNMLSDFCHATKLHASPEKKQTPLAIQYLESLQMDQAEGFRLLKELGDFSLFFSGFFHDSLSRKTVDVDYYISMGGNAYHRLHSMIQSSKYGDAFRETFFELASNFVRFVDALSEISENCKVAKDSDLLRLYERWLSTGSERIRKKLNEFGIYPGSFQHPGTTH